MQILEHELKIRKQQKVGDFSQTLRSQGLKFRKYRPIFRRYFVCRLTSTRYIPLIYRSTEISKFFCIYRRYFADISVFYRFFGIFPDRSVLFTASALFMNSTFRATVHYSIKIVAWEVRTLPKTGGFQPPIH